MRREQGLGALDRRDGDIHLHRSCGRIYRQPLVARFAMKALLISFVSGLVFALGLGVSGMTRPIKIIGFLDFFGSWDPSLALVMIGAICVYFVAYRRSRKMASPLLLARFSVPTRTELDWRLILGAAIFGAGWALGGFCPGPAITSLASESAPVAIFVAAMAAGIYLHALITSKSKQGSLSNVVQVATDS
jgi:hypothetical protein